MFSLTLEIVIRLVLWLLLTYLEDFSPSVVDKVRQIPFNISSEPAKVNSEQTWMQCLIA